MQYVLGVALEYKKYKKFARVRIFADDHLIDDLKLDKDISTKTVSYGPITVGPNFKTDTSGTIDIPKKLFFYEVDESVLKYNIRIEVENDDTNFNNGFMTKWSYLVFHKVFLIPKPYLDYAKLDELALKNKPILAKPVKPDRIPWRFNWPAMAQVVIDRHLVGVTGFEKPPASLYQKGGSFSVKYPIMTYKQKSQGVKFNILAPSGWATLINKDERIIAIGDWLFVYCQQFDLINTVNENQ
tara:strand:- start:834 stop:1556 length:723 start_codon:yes stop_codon:yes gene_type:complete